MGRPSNLDLVKLMSESGGVAGENNRANFYPVGAATINLRSLGSRFTTVVFNGRRFPEQFSVDTGRFNNITWIPNAAVGSVETLKAGGAATYGADAIAGVVNYVTRKGFEGLELNGDYRYIDDSDGDYGVDALWGTNLGAAGELLVSLSYQHRSALNEIDRDWTQLHMLESPNSWQSLTSAISNPGTVVFQRPVAGSQVSFTPTQIPLNLMQMSAGGSMRDVGCAELGGFRGWTNTPTPGCYTNTAETEELVTEQNSYNLYIEHNLEAGGLRFHTEALVYRQDIPNIALAGTFVNNPDAWPLAPSVNGAPRVQQNINGTNAYFVPGTNPAVANLLNDLRNPDGSTAFTAAQIAAITSATGPGTRRLAEFPVEAVRQRRLAARRRRSPGRPSDDVPPHRGDRRRPARVLGHGPRVGSGADVQPRRGLEGSRRHPGHRHAGRAQRLRRSQLHRHDARRKRLPVVQSLLLRDRAQRLHRRAESVLRVRPREQPRAGRMDVQPGVVQARLQELRRRSDRARRPRHPVARRSDQAGGRRPVPPAGRARHDGCDQQSRQQSVHGNRRDGLRPHCARRRVAVRPSADGVRRPSQRVPAGSAALPGGRGLSSRRSCRCSTAST